MGRKKKEETKKSSNKRTIILVSILVILIIILIALIIFVSTMNKEEKIDNNVNKRDDNIIYNENKDVISDKVSGNVKFTNIKCSYDGFRSLLEYTITNNGTESIILGDYNLVVKDNNNEIIAIMVPGTSQELKPSEKLDTGNVIDIDLSNASSIELELNK